MTLPMERAHPEDLSGGCFIKKIQVFCRELNFLTIHNTLIYVSQWSACAKQVFQINNIIFCSGLATRLCAGEVTPTMELCKAFNHLTNQKYIQYETQEVLFHLNL